MQVIPTNEPKCPICGAGEHQPVPGAGLPPGDLRQCRGCDTVYRVVRGVAMPRYGATPLRRHELRRMSQHGVQQCRRCGYIAADRQKGHQELPVGNAYTDGTGWIWAEFMIDPIEAARSVACPWSVH